MADIVVKNFDLYNTVFYWVSYNPVSLNTTYEQELNVAKSYYTTFTTSNIYGSQIDFFNKLAGQSVTSPGINFNITIQTMPLLWGKYWWEQLMYYTNYRVVTAVADSNPNLYTDFSESVGTLYYVSRNNSNQYLADKPFNRVIENLLIPNLNETITSFFVEVLSTSNINSNNINLSAAKYANNDLQSVINSNPALTGYINETYGWLSRLLPFNTIFIGNLITPYYWSVPINYENSTLQVDFSNASVSTNVQLTINNLKAT